MYISLYMTASAEGLWSNTVGLGWFLYAFKPLAALTGTQKVLFCDASSFTDIDYFLEHSRPSNKTKDWKREQLLCLLNAATDLRFSITLKPQNLSSPVSQSCATGSISCPTNRTIGASGIKAAFSRRHRNSRQRIKSWFCFVVTRNYSS